MGAPGRGHLLANYIRYRGQGNNMATRIATNRNHKTQRAKGEEVNFSDQIKGEGEKSIYFQTDCNDSLISISPSKKAKLLNTERNGRPKTLTCKLDRSFYDRPTEVLAKQLLGKVLYRALDNGEVLCGRIVETEGYLGEVDKACHAFGGKRTARSEPMYMAPGTAYVYIIYGMYHCLNISSQEPGACVLIRALEPLQGRRICC